jgi:cytochrome c oxidase cbb3-type subunit III
MLTNIKKIILSILVICLPMILFGQAIAATPAVSTDMKLDLNMVLLFFAVLLLLPLYYTGKTFLYAAGFYTDKKKNTSSVNKTLISVLLCLFISTLAFSQSPAAAPIPGVALPSHWITVTLVTIIALEFIFIIYFTTQITGFLHPKVAKALQTNAENETSWFQTFWEKINNFKPIGEEDTMDTGHNYDGIRELNNVTPPWFITAFIFSILFGIGYLYVYYVAKSAPLQIEEFNMAMKKAEDEKAQYLAMQGNNVDETTVKMLGAADIASGRSTFQAKCTACHGPAGGSMPGGVGPNLTDEYWIHGGNISSIFKTIKYGWPDKGMISWKDQLSPMQIAQLASYIKSIRGSKPTGAKEPQGDLYIEEGIKSDSLTTDSLTTTMVNTTTVITK